MTPCERIVQLFTIPPPSGSNLDWFANGLLSIAVDTPFIALEMVPVPGYEPPIRQLQVEESGRVLTPDGTFAARVFRPLLARLAVMASHETRTEFQPYGGRYSLNRSGTDGPQQLDLEFTNTPAVQRLTITRVPASITSPTWTVA
jgi:hypothetical protein